MSFKPGMKPTAPTGKGFEFEGRTKWSPAALLAVIVLLFALFWLTGAIIGMLLGVLK